MSFLPLPVPVPIRQRDERQHWRVQIGAGLWVENAPPRRLILHGDRVVASYVIGSVVEERMLLVQMLQAGWMTAVDLAPRWGYHRNTLGNWQWRYRYFGLDGLVDERLPGQRERLEPVVRAAAEVLRRRGRRLSVAALRRALAEQGHGSLPVGAVSWLQGALLQPEVLGLPLEEERRDEPPDAPGGGGAPSGGSGDDPEPEQGQAAGERRDAPEPPVDRAVSIRHAGMALALPVLQQVLDPLQPHLEAVWGRPSWHYRPWQMIAGFIFYVLGGYRNPEQVKAAPARDFGPLLGRRRAPACITLRRRLRAMAKVAEPVLELQRQLARQYLQLGWVEPGWWLVDNHFVPYYGAQAWGKGWYPQRRLPHPGHFQDWVHDRNGRPLWLHFTQGFELFADALPAVADALQALTGERPVLVFDRGGFSSQVFTALNARGAGWVTWLKGRVQLPAAAFTLRGELPSSRPGGPAQVVHYACTTHAVAGCHAQVATVVWHDGDPAKQVGLLTNLDRLEPDRFRPLDLIGMLQGRWAQENSFKAQEQHVDLGWTNGYAHEPAAQTPVPNPRVRALRHRLARRTQQLRRAMDRGLPRRAATQATYRRKLGMLQGQITRTERELDATTALVPYGSLGRKATHQLRAGRALLAPVLRALTQHLRLQLRDAIGAVFADHREHDKVLRVLLHTPGRYISGEDADWVLLTAPQMPRYAVALTALVAAANAAQAHAPARPGHPLRFALETDTAQSAVMHNAALAAGTP